MGPRHPVSEYIHSLKYRQSGETFKEAMARIAGALKDDDDHYKHLKDILYNQRFLPAGRVQAAVGSAKIVTPYNCFVSRKIQDSMEGIMDALGEAAETMRLGGGIGYDFSTLRPRGENIKTLDTDASGPVSFMAIYDAMCKTIASAGHRRGAQMAVLRVDHPDIEEFIRCKRNEGALTAFNISVGVTEQFMFAVRNGLKFPLQFGGRVYREVDARSLWEEIMRSNWDWAEPGVLFIDTINDNNNLWYCEQISATNPCAEQPLPPFGACLLGSFNIASYVKPVLEEYALDLRALQDDIPAVVRAMDNIIDHAKYPLVEQHAEARNKRRMGLGVTGMANAIEALGYPYGSDDYITAQTIILEAIRDGAYRASVELAKEKGPFPLFHEDYLSGNFIKTLPEDLQSQIAAHGIRNSHLTSIAPTGTISVTADNVSSGIEPVFALETERLIHTPEGQQSHVLKDYGLAHFGVKGKTADQCSVMDHVKVLTNASKYVDSAVSKTCNVGPEVSWDQFKAIYMRAYEAGAKGCTTFRSAGKRAGMMKAVVDNSDEPEACFYDPETGTRSCE